MNNRPVYVDEGVYLYLRNMRKKFGTFGNCVKHLIDENNQLVRKNAKLQEQIGELEAEKSDLLMAMATRPTNTLAQANAGQMPQKVVQATVARKQPLPKKGYQKELQKIFNTIDVEEEGVKPSMVLEAEKNMPKLAPPPPPPKKED